jgi:hypothetical protein
MLDTSCLTRLSSSCCPASATRSAIFPQTRPNTVTEHRVGHADTVGSDDSYSVSHDLWHNIDTVCVFPVFPATVPADTLSWNTVTIVRIQEFRLICCKIDKTWSLIPSPQLQSVEFLWFFLMYIQIDSILVYVWLGLVVCTDVVCDNFRCSYSMYFGTKLWITITQILKSEKSITRSQQTTVDTFSRI